MNGSKALVASVLIGAGVGLAAYATLRGVFGMQDMQLEVFTNRITDYVDVVVDKKMGAKQR